MRRPWCSVADGSEPRGNASASRRYSRCWLGAPPPSRLLTREVVYWMRGGRSFERASSERNLSRTFSVIRETLLSYLLWESAAHQPIDPVAKTAPPLGVS